jgi:GcrA cell cycle regulator
MGPLWTDDRIEILTKLWNEGRSGSEIATILHGVTRSAVISKVKRLGLAPRESGYEHHKRPLKAAKRIRAPGTPRVRAPKINPIKYTPPALVAPIIVNGVTLSRRSTCKWPFGEPDDSDFHYCDSPSELGRSYCPTHSHEAHSHKPVRLIYVRASIT